MDRITRTSADWRVLDISMDGKRRTRLTDLIEVRNLGDIAQIYYSEVLYLLRHAIEGLVHSHALGIPVVTEPNDDDSVFLGFDGLVDVPAGGEVRKKVGHGWGTKSIFGNDHCYRITRGVYCEPR